MPKIVVDGATLSCDQGDASSKLVVPPDEQIDSDDAQMATINNHTANLNIMPFGMCKSMANPAVASATAAANGTLTPQPCVPATSSPWEPGAAHVDLNGTPALTDDSTCKCQHAGTISIDDPGSEAEITP